MALRLTPPDGFSGDEEGEFRDKKLEEKKRLLGGVGEAIKSAGRMSENVRGGEHASVLVVFTLIGVGDLAAIYLDVSKCRLRHITNKHAHEAQREEGPLHRRAASHRNVHLGPLHIFHLMYQGMYSAGCLRRIQCGSSLQGGDKSPRGYTLGGKVESDKQKILTSSYCVQRPIVVVVVVGKMGAMTLIMR